LLEKHEDNEIVGVEEKDTIPVQTLIKYIEQLKDAGFDKDRIKDLAFKDLGFRESNLPEELSALMKRL
jgi:hypothetical protein